ncbi:MAG TPA: alkylmercury lyase family protein [Candidatus Dormibacteraeota bacterium]|nr:alkylmercury lyase family protein [Candidatus Dormibacteraeota bacterium]
MSQDHLRPDGEAIGLAPERCGSRRGSELAPPERELYRWILRRFAAASPPSVSDVERAAAEQGIAAGAALRRMEEVDLVHRRPDGTIWCAYPFSAQPTGHTVELEGGQPPLHAMCAIDALGIPLMLRRGAVVRCAEPTTGRELVIRIDPTGESRSEPAGPVALIARTLGEGPLASSCCPLINLFGSRRLAEEFLGGRPDLTGAVLSLTDAVILARAVFEGVLDDPPPEWPVSPPASPGPSSRSRRDRRS